MNDVSQVLQKRSENDTQLGNAATMVTKFTVGRRRASFVVSFCLVHR